MKMATDRLALWAPRILALFMIALLSLFALDALEEGGGLIHVAAVLVMHLLPSIILIVALMLAWRRPWLGALLFGGAALGYAAWTGRDHLDWIAVISGPLLLTAALFLLSWIIGLRKQTRAPA
jgi:hypothetical protein